MYREIIRNFDKTQKYNKILYRDSVIQIGKTKF